MSKDRIISNSEDFNNKKEKIKKAGADNLHIVSDFDKTLTYANINGQKFPGVISILRQDGRYLGEDYAQKARALFEKYHPIEIDENRSIQEKKKKMKEWWKTHFKLIINKGLKKNHLEKIINEEPIKLREGCLDFLDYLNKNKIPLIILSSIGLGNLIPMILRKHNRLYKNINIITNQYEFDEKGNSIRVKEPIIHSWNKDETAIPKNIYENIKDRKNVLLIGDSIGDLGMIEGFEYRNLIKIGFLNDNIEEKLEKYKENFDLVLTGDQDFSYVNKLIKEILD